MNIVNTQENLLNDMINGVNWAYPGLEKIDGTHGIFDSTFQEGQIPLISGGGSGHEPSDWGFIGSGMLTGAIMGDIFTPPSASEIVAFVTKALHQRKVFFIVKNFRSDIHGFCEAKKQLIANGWEVGMCVVADDVSVNNNSLKKRKRGVAGTIFVSKILGAYARWGASIAELNAVADKLLPEIKTIGLAFSGSYIPGTKQKTFYLADNEIFYGVGIHGEPGYRKEKNKSSELLADELVNKLQFNFHWRSDEQYAVLINSLGGMTTMETMIFNNDVRQLLEIKKQKVLFSKVGTFMTSNGMQGISLTLLRMLNHRWLKALQEDVKVPAWS